MDASGEGRTAPPARTRRTRLRTAVLVCAAAALAGGTVSASATTAPAQDPAPDPVVLVDCFSEAQVRPDEYLLACGDGNNRLVRLDWDTWGPKTATATGTDLVNDCRPYCAAGRFHAYPVTVTLANPKPWAEHPDVQRFTTIRLLYTDTAPHPVPEDVTYKLLG
ncbi:hypothetical protein [Streptomyces sp. NPDC090022]|uniref:hypothetical protein n=1 Tax=Streptomyces sp. NPDC090022 TaxID=3365920 RepID=UPI00381EE51B